MLFLFLTRKGSCCLDAPKRNSNGNADASKGSGATQALSFLLPSSEIHSEVYNTDERARLQAHASEIIASLMKASRFFEDTLRGNAVFFLPGKCRHNCCFDASKRNSNGDSNASKGSEATQAFLLPSSEILGL